jgi:hypothetical protein
MELDKAKELTAPKCVFFDGNICEVLVQPTDKIVKDPTDEDLKIYNAMEKITNGKGMTCNQGAYYMYYITPVCVFVTSANDANLFVTFINDEAHVIPSKSKKSSAASMSELSDTPQQQVKKPLSKKPCGYGTNCSNKNCRFVHPNKAASMPEPNETSHMQVKKSFAETSCRYGANCSNKNCKFLHSKAASEPELNETPQMQIKKPKSETLCRYALNCSNKNCKFVHHTTVSDTPDVNGSESKDWRKKN